jgi:hypothetical protein
MRVIVTNKVDRDQWDEFVTRHPFGSVYHTSAWQEVILETYGYQPLYHLLLDDHANLKAAISSAFVRSRLTGNRIVSYPFSDTCDPLVQTSDELESLLEALERSRIEMGARFIELRLNHSKQFIDNGSSQQEYCSHLLPLDQESEGLFLSFHKSSIQRAIKKAEKQDLEILTGESEREVKSFYRLHVKTRKKHGIPIQPFRFFTRLWNSLVPREMISLLLVRHKARYLAGIITLCFKGTSYYKFGASDEGYLHLRGNQLLLWQAIRQAKDKGCTSFDLGRASAVNKGLNQYKGRWGTQPIPLHYLRTPKGRKLSVLTEASGQHELLKSMMKLMPSSVIRMSGALFYKHFA